MESLKTSENDTHDHYSIPHVFTCKGVTHNLKAHAGSQIIHPNADHGLSEKKYFTKLFNFLSLKTGGLFAPFGYPNTDCRLNP